MRNKAVIKCWWIKPKYWDASCDVPAMRVLRPGSMLVETLRFSFSFLRKEGDSMFLDMLLSLVVEILSTSVSLVFCWVTFVTYKRLRYGGWRVFSTPLSIREAEEIFSSPLKLRQTVKSVIADREGRFCKIDFSTLKIDRAEKTITVDYK